MVNKKSIPLIIVLIIVFINNLSFSQCTTNPKIIIDSTYGLSKTLNSNAIQTEGQTYKWKPSKGLSCSECLKPIFLFSLDTIVNYTLTTFDRNQKCVRIDKFKVVSENRNVKEATIDRDLDIHEIKEGPIGRQGFIPNPDLKVNESAPYTNVEEQAYFSGYKDFLMNNLKYPQTAIEDAISGRCYLTFIVSETGVISNIQVARGVSGCPDCDAEAVRIVKLMPAWTPAKIGGKPVRSYFNLSISFSIG